MCVSLREGGEKSGSGGGNREERRSGRERDRTSTIVWNYIGSVSGSVGIAKLLDFLLILYPFVRLQCCLVRQETIVCRLYVQFTIAPCIILVVY